MSELAQAFGVPRPPGAVVCWPKPWIEAAVLAGFAHDKGNGCWVFDDDTMRDMLARFAEAIAEDAHNAKPCNGVDV